MFAEGAWSKPLPVETPETKPFWDACREGRLVVQRCRACGEYQFPFRGMCAHCWTVGQLDVIDSRGRATVWTYSIIYRNDTPGFAEDLPYVAAMVELEEGGLKMMTNIVNCAPEEVSIGMSVRLTFVDAQAGHRLPMFEPRGGK